MARFGAGGLMALLALAATADAAGFNYTGCTLPGTNPLATTSGQRVGVCVNLNAQVRALMTPVVDQYSAFQLSGSNYAFPTDSGYIMQGYGWVPAITQSLFNCSVRNWDPQTFYSVIDISYGGVSTTSPRIYKQFTYDGCTGTLVSAYTWPILTAIITVEKGVPQYIAWDDGCFFCAANDASVCQYYAFDSGTMAAAQTDDYMSCLTPLSTCYTSTPTPTRTPMASFSPTSTPSVTPTPNITGTLTPSASPAPANVSANFTIPQSECDLKLFVVWSGSDANNQYFVSANKRFSRFRQFGTATAFQSAINIGLQGLTIAQDAIGLVDGVPGRLLPGSQVRRRMRRLHGGFAGAPEADGAEAEADKPKNSELEDVLSQVRAAEVEVGVPAATSAVPVPMGPSAMSAPQLMPGMHVNKANGNKVEARLAVHYAEARAHLMEDAAWKAKLEREEEENRARREAAEQAEAAEAGPVAPELTY